MAVGPMPPPSRERILLRMDCNQIRAFIAVILLVIVAAASAFGSQGHAATGHREMRRPAAVQSAATDDGRRFF